MNRSEKVLREVLTNQEEIDEFLKQETLEEIYEFVLKRDNSITKKEFDSCIAEIIEKYLAIEKANAVEKGRIKEKDMDMIAGGKGMLSKSMASVLSTLMLTTGANIPVNATNGEETNKTGIKSSIMEKVNYVIEKIGDAKRFVVKKGEEGFEKTSKILKEHPWIKPVLCVVIVLAVGSGTVFAINKHKEKNKNKVIDPVASPDLTADDEGEEGEKKEEEKKEEEKKEEEKKEEEKKQRDAITRVLRKISNNPEEVKQFGENTWKERYEFLSRKDSSITEEGFCSYYRVKPSDLTDEAQKKQKERRAIDRAVSETSSIYWNIKTWKERYEFISRKNSSITKEGFCSYYNVDPSLLTEESERFEQAAAPEAAVSGEGGNQEELEQAAAPEAAVSGEGDDQEGSEHVDSAEAAVSGEGDDQEGSEHVDSAEAAVSGEEGSQEGSEDAVLPPSEAAGGVEGDNQEGSEQAASAETAVSGEEGSQEELEQAASAEVAVGGGEGNQEGLEHVDSAEAAVSGEGGNQEGSEHVDSAEAAVSGEEGSQEGSEDAVLPPSEAAGGVEGDNQEGSEDAVLPPSEAAGGVEGDNQEGSEHVDSAEAAIADETGENVNSQGSGKREDKKIPIVNIPKASSSPVAVTVEYNNEKQLLKEMIKDTVETTQWLDKNGGFSDEESRDKYNGCVYILNDDGKTFEERKKAYDELQEMAKSFRPKSLLEGAFGWLRWK